MTLWISSFAGFAVEVTRARGQFLWLVKPVRIDTQRKYLIYLASNVRNMKQV